jgi:hypothetical protein
MGASFIGYRFFISPLMNPGACILDAFGQIRIWLQLLASDRLIVVFDPGDRS